MDYDKNKMMSKGRTCRVVLQRCDLERCDCVEGLPGLKTPILSEDSDVSVRSASPAQWAKRRRSFDDEQDEGPSPKVGTSRRGRGRPPTTGEYVGLAKAKAAYNMEMRKSQDLECEREFDRRIAELRETASVSGERLSVSTDDEAREAEEERLSILQLHGKFESSMAVVREVAMKSLNLKGTYVKHLKEAAKVGMECAEALLERTSSEEVKLLMAANRAQKTEIKVLRQEMAELRREVARAAPAPAQPGTEEMLRSVMVQVGTMLNARLAGLEDRLLPERRVRPPLAADVSKEARPVPAARGLKPKEAPEAAPEEAHQTVPEEPWTVVGSKSSRRSQKKSGPPAQPVPRPARPARPQAAKPAKKPQRPPRVKVPRLHPPRAAAVVITLQPAAEEGGLTYAKVIAEAKEKIDLGALGVPAGIRMRRAATGARIIEVPGAEKVSLADSLATKLREVFKDPEIVKISRPATTADLRVSGLDDSIDSTELVAAVAKAGSCSVEMIKAGLIRRGAGGMGTALVRCPVTAAKQVVARGRLLVGWVSAQVRLLQPRPRRCYRCLSYGHISAQCESEVDRSDECYRCGQKGHLANGCSAAPHCTTCAAASKPADHLSGGKACAKSPGKRVRGRQTARVAQAKSQMEQ